MTVGGQTQLSVLNCNAMSQVTSLRTGVDANATGTKDATEAYGYDDTTGLLTTQTVTRTSDNQPLLNLAYGYDRGGSVGSGTSGKTGQLTHITNNLDRNKDRVYEFDALGRLTKAKGGRAADAPVANATADWTQTYSYDRYGNKTGVTASGTTVGGSNPVPTDGIATLAYDQTTNRINTSWYQYDNAGNLVKGPDANGVLRRYEYDAAGRLTVIRDDANPSNVIETYTYGADRNRLANTTSSQTTYYVWDESSVIQEYSESTGSTIPIYSKGYVYSGGSLLSTGTNSGGTEVTEFHHPDRLGTKLITNPSANSSFEQATLPFGTELVGEESGVGINQKFTSYDRSGSTGLDYALNRTYSSGHGRFTQVDPIGIEATDFEVPQSLNLFAYVNNRPTDYVDPDGQLMSIGFCAAEFSAEQCGIFGSGWIFPFWYFSGGGGGGHRPPVSNPPRPITNPSTGSNFVAGPGIWRRIIEELNPLTALDCGEFAVAAIGIATSCLSTPDSPECYKAILDSLSSLGRCLDDKGHHVLAFAVKQLDKAVQVVATVIVNSLPKQVRDPIIIGGGEGGGIDPGYRPDPGPTAKNPGKPKVLKPGNEPPVPPRSQTRRKAPVRRNGGRN
jgi:RHS repeat-associated protein